MVPKHPTMEFQPLCQWPWHRPDSPINFINHSRTLPTTCWYKIVPERASVALCFDFNSLGCRKQYGGPVAAALVLRSMRMMAMPSNDTETFLSPNVSSTSPSRRPHTTLCLLPKVRGVQPSPRFADGKPKETGWLVTGKTDTRSHGQRQNGSDRGGSNRNESERSAASRGSRANRASDLF